VSPTRRQLEVAAAIVRCGSHEAAARSLGLSVQTVRNQVSKLIARTGSTTGFYGVLVILGWLTSPDIER
jgi:DNA-binding NarL/FixJ family response regulator